MKDEIFGVFMAGACSGITSDAITHPISTIKARLYTTQLGTNIGTFGLMKQVIKNEGAKSLYTGFSVTIGSAPARALYFGGYEMSKRTIGSLGEGAANHPFSHFLSGVLAQGSGSLIWVPMDVMKERVQVQNPGAIRPYTSAFDCGRRIIVEEGVANLYRGFLLHQGLWGPFNAVFWPLFERSKVLLSNGVDDYNSTHTIHIPLLGVTAVSALVSAAVAGGVTNPMDLIKVRLQTNPNYTGAVDCLSSLIKEKGMMALYNGTGARMLWIAPNMMLTMTLFDAFRPLF